MHTEEPWCKSSDVEVKVLKTGAGCVQSQQMALIVLCSSPHLNSLAVVSHTSFTGNKMANSDGPFDENAVFFFAIMDMVLGNVAYIVFSIESKHFPSNTE